MSLLVSCKEFKMWITLSLFFLATFLLFIKLRNVYKTFEKLGIKGPPPTFLLGNLLDLYRLKPGQTRARVFMEWVSKYGLVFGYFEGLYPVLYVANPDTLQQILQTDFNNFVNRPFRDDHFGGELGDTFNNRGQRWKRVRSVLSPVFSPANMRQVAPSVNEKVQLLIGKFKEISSKSEGFDIYLQFQMLTLDIIAKAVFGTDINCIMDGSHPFVHHCKETFRRIATKPIFFEAVSRGCPGINIRKCIYAALSFADKLINGTVDFWTHLYYLSGVAKKVMEERKQSPIYSTEPDLLGLMMKYESGEVIAETSSHIKGNFKKLMTVQEIQMNCWIFLIAGFETSSTVLAYLAHVLCSYPDVQEKLAAEIGQFQDNESDENGELSHSTTLKMEYLDQVIRETLRMFPPAPDAIRRESIEKIGLKIPGRTVTIPKGMTFQIGVLATHYDPKFWDSPETFDPSRFAMEKKKNHHNFQYLPFGLGPRGCIGAKLAMMEIRLAVISLVQNFRIEPCDKTTRELEFLEGITRTPKDGVFIKLTDRAM